jgi:hypothetical protein
MAGFPRRPKRKLRESARYVNATNHSIIIFLDTFYRIGQSALIGGFLAFYLLDIFVVAIADATITKYLSGVHSSLVSVGRTIVVWMLELVLYYAGSEAIRQQYGHKWDVYSPLKVAGFAIVVASIFMYDGHIRLPFLDYSSVSKKPSLALKQEDYEADRTSETTGTPVVLADDKIVPAS